MANTAIRLDPNFAAPYLATQGLAQYNLRNFDEAVESLLRSIAINPKDQAPFLILIAAYGQLGQLNQASVALDQMNQLFQQEYGREFSIDLLRDQFPFHNRLDREHLLEGLQKAGAPEF
jgi:tetratricopeptide (TPR) repeat protein